MSEFSIVLKNLRVSMELTQENLADDLKISRSAVSMYESGLREPDFETLELIADYFNVDIDYLLGRSLRTTLLPASDQDEFISLFRRLDAIDRARIIERIETMLESDKYKKDSSQKAM